MLELVVEEGTGKLAQLPGYRVAGKTGTAQRTVAGRFDNEHHIAWFAGFLPLPDPRVVIVVELQDPVGDFWASSAAAPVFSRVAAAAASLLGIPHSIEPEIKYATSPTTIRLDQESRGDA
jgi:cell division protein FtsI/penicillin-binding protein 2